MIGYTWYHADNQGSFSFVALFDPTNTLTGLLFNVLDSNEYPTPSLKKVLDSLGAPDYWRIGYDSSSTLPLNPDERKGSIPWDLVYENGIYIHMQIPGPLTLAEADGNSKRAVINICEQAEAIKTIAFLTSPYQDIRHRSPDQVLPNLDPELLMNDREVEDAFGLSKQEVMDYFLTSQDVCLITK